MARLKKEPVQSDSETESDATTCSEDEGAGQLWAEAEDDLYDLVESLKDKLAEIHPGIGDRVSLAKFVAFIESNSTCL